MVTVIVEEVRKPRPIAPAAAIEEMPQIISTTIIEIVGVLTFYTPVNFFSKACGF